MSSVNDWALDGRWPDLVLLLHVPAEQLASRMERRVLDRFERESIEFHDRVSAGFLEMAGKDPDRWVLIDANRSHSDVAATIRTAVLERLGLVNAGASRLFDAVVGQPSAVALLSASVDEPVHAYLFVGPTGSGKRTAARSFAALLVDPTGDADGRDARLALAGVHPDVREIERIGPAISAPQASEIVSLASLAPTEGRRKVLVLHDFHLIAPPAASRLLKTIEEPSPSTIFLILADDIPPDLVTIASRCVRVDFRTLTVDDVAGALESEGVPSTAAREAAAAAGGDLDRARLLATDPQLAERRHAFAGVAARLDGTGATVGRIVDELLGLIDAAADPLKERHAAELTELEARVSQMGNAGRGARSSTTATSASCDGTASTNCGPGSAWSPVPTAMPWPRARVAMRRRWRRPSSTCTARSKRSNATRTRRSCCSPCSCASHRSRPDRPQLVNAGGGRFPRARDSAGERACALRTRTSRAGGLRCGARSAGC